MTFEKVQNVFRVSVKALSIIGLIMAALLSYLGFDMVIAEIRKLNIPMEKVWENLSWNLIQLAIGNLVLTAILAYFWCAFKREKVTVKRVLITGLKAYPLIYLAIVDGLFLTLLNYSYNGPWKPYIEPITLIYLFVTMSMFVVSKLPRDIMKDLKMAPAVIKSIIEESKSKKKA